MKLNKIAWQKKFIMYVYVDWKLIPRVTSTLEACGFNTDVKNNLGNDDRELSIEVTCENASFAHQIIKSIIQ